MAATLPDYSSGEHRLAGTTLLVDASGAPLLVSGRAVGGAKPVDVAILDAAGNQITSFGGSPSAATPLKLISAATTNPTSVKGSPGTLYGVQVTNVAAAIRYLKFYDTASAPTVGTDVPVKIIGIPGNAAGAGAMVAFPVGVKFLTGIAFALTTGITDADTGAVGANEIALSVDYT